MGFLNQSKPIMLSRTAKQRRDSPSSVRVIVFCACKIKDRSGRACFWSSFKWLHPPVKQYWSDYSSSPSCKLSFSSISLFIIYSPGCLTQPVRMYKRGMQYIVVCVTCISIPILCVLNHSCPSLHVNAFYLERLAFKHYIFLVCALPGNQTHDVTIATIDMHYQFQRKDFTSVAILVSGFICSNQIWYLSRLFLYMWAYMAGEI